jgi:hypothetical protein
MKTIFLVATFSCVCLFGQTTTISASSTIIDRQGNLLTGSVCWGGISGLIYSPIVGGCTQIAAGTSPSYTIPNGTYSVWINELSPVSFTAPTPLFQASGVVLSGTPIAVDGYLQGQFGISVAGTYVYGSLLNAGIISVTCNGNAVTLMGNPQQNQEVQISNLSGTTACTIAGNGSSIFYQGSSASPQTLAAHASWIGTYVYNYDLAGLGHNAWVVSHLGT